MYNGCFRGITRLKLDSRHCCRGQRLTPRQDRCRWVPGWDVASSLAEDLDGAGQWPERWATEWACR